MVQALQVVALWYQKHVPKRIVAEAAVVLVGVAATAADIVAATVVEIAVAAAATVAVVMAAVAATADTETTTVAAETAVNPPWFHRPDTTPPQRIAIVGGGFAGLMMAHALRDTSFPIFLFDEHASLPNPTCQNPAMVLRPYLSPDFNTLDQYYTTAFEGMHQFILKAAPQAILGRGIQFLPATDRARIKLSQIEKRRGIQAGFLEEALLIHPQRLTEILVHTLQGYVNFCLDKKVDLLALRKEFDTVVLATGSVLTSPYIDPGALEVCGGQVSLIPENEFSKTMKHTLAYEGYCTPSINGQHILGATFRHRASPPDKGKPEGVTEVDHDLNLRALAKVAPELAHSFASSPKQGWTGLRLTSRDHLPVIGPLLPKEKWLTDFAHLARGSLRHPYPKATYYPNVFASLAHGSKGLASSWFASEILRALILNEPLPLSEKLWQAIHPARFWFRNLKRTPHASTSVS